MLNLVRLTQADIESRISKIRGVPKERKRSFELHQGPRIADRKKKRDRTI
jgi:hypothetical protein